MPRKKKSEEIVEAAEALSEKAAADTAEAPKTRGKRKKKSDIVEVIDELEAAVEKPKRRGRAKKSADAVLDTVDEKVEETKEILPVSEETAPEISEETASETSEEAVVSKRRGRSRKSASEVEEKASEPEEKADSTLPEENQDSEEAVSDPAKRRGRSKKTVAAPVYIQSVMGGQISVDEILARIKAAAPTFEAVYIKPEENKAYFVTDGVTGNIALW